MDCVVKGKSALLLINYYNYSTVGKLSALLLKMFPVITRRGGGGGFLHQTIKLLFR
jgi:hypothetical protein